MTTTIVRPQAQDDIEEAVLWYRAIDPIPLQLLVRLPREC